MAKYCSTFVSMPVEQLHGCGSYGSLMCYIIFNCIGSIPRINGTFGQGVGPIFLDNVRCTGLERRLFECLHDGIEVESCTHSQDAGVACLAGNEKLFS